MVFTINVYKEDAGFSYSAESTLYIFSFLKKKPKYYPARTLNN